MHSILIVENDAQTARLLCSVLSPVGYRTEVEPDERAAKARIETEHPDLVLQNVLLPGADGFSLLGLCLGRDIPVILLGGEENTNLCQKGLRDGAEDWIIKPIRTAEVPARIEKALRRRAGDRQPIVLGDVTIDPVGRAAQKNGADLQLTPMQFNLLLLLARNKNAVVSREHITASVWHCGWMGKSRTIDNHISHLRARTGLTIASVPRIGYRLVWRGASDPEST